MYFFKFKFIFLVGRPPGSKSKGKLEAKWAQQVAQGTPITPSPPTSPSPPLSELNQNETPGKNIKFPLSDNSNTIKFTSSHPENTQNINSRSSSPEKNTSPG